MTQPASPEPDVPLTFGRIALWTILLILLLVGIVLYFIYEGRILPLLSLEPTR